MECAEDGLGAVHLNITLYLFYAIGVNENDSIAA